ncbi:hypothetical protein LMH87_003643 [Akanthomyces muscarius]|uniref:Uncharacterized protein n=1 Tax=Akanthomyces muscarius TaxID=2231603 RepID=A0A9W8Q1T7_AKAMU|nr:hypothetical protein LMH87_003643 [Akanthomyces muscarius]KAJ4144773.1 hypothetical protein LMH87_003643 [Akanthomyces muscarius]
MAPSERSFRRCAVTDSVLQRCIARPPLQCVSAEMPGKLRSAGRDRGTLQALFLAVHAVLQAHLYLRLGSLPSLAFCPAAKYHPQQSPQKYGAAAAPRIRVVAGLGRPLLSFLPHSFHLPWFFCPQHFAPFAFSRYTIYEADFIRPYDVLCTPPTTSNHDFVPPLRISPFASPFASSYDLDIFIVSIFEHIAAARLEE